MSGTAMERAVTETVQFIRAEGFHFKSSEAEAIGPELLAMEGLTTAAAVEHVRNHPAMELHAQLVWHDYSAAELYRQSQIQYFRRGIKMVRSTSDGRVIEERFFHRVARTQLADADSLSESIGVAPTAVKRLIDAVRPQGIPIAPPERPQGVPLPAPVRPVGVPLSRVEPPQPKERFDAEWRQQAEAIVPSEEALALQAREAAVLLAERFASYRIILARIDPPLGAVFRAIDRLSLEAARQADG